jgi:hypothetical protein
MGVENLIIIDPQDAVMVCSKDREQDLNQLLSN